MKTGTKNFITRFGKHIIGIGKKYSINKVLLFGSAVDDIEKAEDYDIAISGYPEGKFYEIVSKLDRILDKSCDIIDYDLHKVDRHPLSKIIDRDGELLYEK